MKITRENLYLNLLQRAKVVSAVRRFFNERNFIEVETPIRNPSIIPEAQIDILKSEGYFLQASPELCMKRLTSYGFGNIYQICKVFRKNERGERHLPEFTMLEWYCSPCSYLDLMGHCRALLRHIAFQIESASIIKYQGKTIDLSKDWEMLTVEEAFNKYGHKSLSKAIFVAKVNDIT